MCIGDVEEGGETVFPAGQAMHSDFDVDEYLEQKGLTAVFEGLDWEKELISVCRCESALSFSLAHAGAM